MRSLIVVATTTEQMVNRFPKASLIEALNLRDYLEQTGDYRSVSIYELEKSEGPLRQWTELQEGPR